MQKWQFLVEINETAICTNMKNLYFFYGSIEEIPAHFQIAVLEKKKIVLPPKNCTGVFFDVLLTTETVTKVGKRTKNAVKCTKTGQNCPEKKASVRIVQSPEVFSCTQNSLKNFP